MKDITIGIIGGTGGMGRWFENFFSQAGYRVIIAGRKTELTYTGLVEQSNVVILSVPIDAAIDITEKIGPFFRRDQLLLDVCSQKEKIVKKMIHSAPCQILGTHPLFGPFTKSVKGQNIIICPCNTTNWLKWFENEVESKGAVVTRMDPLTHDRNMAVVQGLTHLLTICMGRTLQKMKMPLDKALLYSTPIFRVKLDLIGRLFAQDHELFKDLIGNNKYMNTVLDTFTAAMDEAREHLVPEKDENSAAFMREIKDFIGDFTRHGLTESNRLLDAVYSEDT